MSKLDVYMFYTHVEYQCFSQREYILVRGWRGVDPNKLRGMWTGDSGVKNRNSETLYGAKGICFGMTIAYLIAPLGMYGVNLLGYFVKPDVISIIRGATNFQKMYFLTYPLGRNPITGVDVAEFFCDALKDQNRLTCYDSRYIKYIPELINLVVKNGPGWKYMIKIGMGSRGGHAFALKREAGSISFFDCNKGEYRYPDNNCGPALMKDLLVGFFLEFYSDINSMEVLSFK